MSISANVSGTVKTLPKNDVAFVQRCALQVSEGGKAASSAAWHDRLPSALLNQDAQLVAGAIAHLVHLVRAESVSKTFMSNRYHVSGREGVLLGRTKRVSFTAASLGEFRIRYFILTLSYDVSDAYPKAVDGCFGATPKSIASIFERAHTFFCVFSLDAIDRIPSNRTSRISKDSVEQGLSRMTIRLIQRLDVIPNSAVLLDVTNRQDCVGKAVVQRFLHKHETKTFGNDETVATIQGCLDDAWMEYDGDSISRYVGASGVEDIPQSVTSSCANRAMRMPVLTAGKGSCTTKAMPRHCPLMSFHKARHSRFYKVHKAACSELYAYLYTTSEEARSSSRTTP